MRWTASSKASSLAKQTYVFQTRCIAFVRLTSLSFHWCASINQSKSIYELLTQALCIQTARELAVCRKLTYPTSFTVSQSYYKRKIFLVKRLGIDAIENDVRVA